MAEAQVLALLAQHNRPFTVQIIADYLAPKGVKKAQSQKALDALVEAGKVKCKVGRSRCMILDLLDSCNSQIFSSLLH